jgi:geranylgeranylglycerol-phosphate geranylgeranyltransferase
MIFASLTSPLLYYIGIFNIIYLIFLIFAIALFLTCAVSILRDQSIENNRIVSKRIKIGMGIVFMGFAFGSPFTTTLLHMF